MKFLLACKSGELTGVVHLLTTQMEYILGVNRGDPYYVQNVPFLPDACCIFKLLPPTLPDSCGKNNVD
jgi:hypothetical protein